MGQECQRCAATRRTCKRTEVFAISAFVVTGLLFLLVAFFAGPLVHLYSLTAGRLDALWKFLACFLIGVSVGAGWCIAATHN